MKVIGQKIKDAQSMWPKRVMCDECQAELEVDESDVYVGEFGCHLFKCPCCGREAAIDGIERDTPPTFSKTFWHTYVGKDKVFHVDNDVIQEMINKCVRLLVSDEAGVGDFTVDARGDAIVYAFKYADCIEILVTQNFYEDTIFEDDYDLIRKEV